jgi:hypothetical protein
MKQGFLSQYFTAVAAKRLSAVEVNKKVSNQHEFNGSQALKQTLGTNDTGDSIYYSARFIWMGEGNETVVADGQLSWYDARFKDDTRSAEWRLYFPTTDVSQLAQEGDLLFIAKCTDNSILCIIVRAGSTTESQMLWLLGVPVQSGRSFVYQNFQGKEDKEVDFVVRFILEELGIEVEERETAYLDSIIAQYNGKLPTTKMFSILTRQTLKNVSPLDDPDGALMAWMNHEEKLFRRIEKLEVESRLKVGFVSQEGTDVDGFIKFSLSVLNKRKSRAGLALENHLEEIFILHKIQYARTVETENKTKPDFLFPSSVAYHNLKFSPELLTMLGVKTTCKDRWRQVLSEASRIENKHLFTLEPGISVNQTNEMKSHKLQLVLPLSIHETYTQNQRDWLLTIKDFIKFVNDKQSKKLL